MFAGRHGRKVWPIRIGGAVRKKTSCSSTDTERPHRCCHPQNEVRLSTARQVLSILLYFIFP